MAFERNFVAFKHVPWGGDTGEVWFDQYGIDLSGAAFKWIFYSLTDGTTKITLNNAAAGSEGLSASYDETAEHPTSGAIVGKTRILPQIAEATLEGLTYADAITDLQLGHTLYVTPFGGLQKVLCFGTLTIKQGGID